MIRKPGEGLAQDACARLGGQRLHQGGEQTLRELQDIFSVHEGHLDVQLGELCLTVSPQVLVAETAGDLKVFLKAGHHEELFDLLRRLGQGVELAWVDAAGHHVVAGSLRRALDEDGRLDLDEAPLVEVVADEFDHLVAEDEVPLHASPAQIEIAVSQAQGLVHLFVVPVDVERRRLGRIEYLHRVGHHLDLARGHVWIGQPFGAAAHQALNAEHVLAPHLGGRGVDFRRDLRVSDHLSYPFSVPQINEYQPAVVAAAVHPAGQGHFLAHVLNPQLSTSVSL